MIAEEAKKNYARALFSPLTARGVWYIFAYAGSRATESSFSPGAGKHFEKLPHDDSPRCRFPSMSNSGRAKQG
jgi:hypothetical protein